MEETTLEHRMLTDTLGAFGEGSTATISPDQGILLLEGWLNALRGDVGAERIVSEAGQLRDHLASGNLDNNVIRQLLINMASHTLALSHEPKIDSSTAQQLKQLATALRNFSSQF
jgi:hypothetical protein